MSDVKKRNWTFEEWSDTYDIILSRFDKLSNVNEKLHYSKMLMEHCLFNYNKLWNVGLGR